MATTHQVRTWWAAYRCKVGEATTILGFAVRLREQAHDAGRALEYALAANGYTPEVVGSHRWCPTGIAGKTCQTSGYNCSLHNYSLALDFDPFKFGNPHFMKRYGDGWNFSDCKFTLAQVRAVEAIRTTNGKQVWKWLGWAIGDTMHFEITVSISDLATGIDWTTVPDYEGDEMALKKGDKGRAVAEAQHAMAQIWGFQMQPDGETWPGFNHDHAVPAARLSVYTGKEFGPGEDGSFGDHMVAQTVRFQRNMDLPQTGVLDATTLGLLMEGLYRKLASSHSSTIDQVARDAAGAAKASASAAQEDADSAHVRLDRAKAAL